MATKPRAYSYIRMSTAEQRLGHSLQRQVDKSIEYAKKHNLELLEQDQLRDIGISAFRGRHAVEGKLGIFLDAIRTGKVARGSYLLVENLDRLSREQVPKALQRFLEIINSGIIVVDIDEDMTYSEHDLDEQSLMYSIMGMSRSHRESKRRSELLKDKWEERRKNARTTPMTGDVAAWLKPMRVQIDANKYKTTGFEIDKAHARTVQRIFNESASGIGNSKITKRLNEAGIPSFGRKGWTSSFVAKLLRNRQVLGEYQPCRFENGKRIPDGQLLNDYLPAIIDNKLFDRVQQGLKERLNHSRGRKGTNFNNLFSSICFCTYCGGKMRYEDKGNFAYLACDGAKRGMGCPIRDGWRYDSFEEAFIQFIDDLDVPSIINSEQHESGRLKLQNDIEARKGKITSLETMRDRTHKALAKTTTSVDYFVKQIDGYTHQINHEQSTLEQMEQQFQAMKVEKVAFEDLQAIIKKLQQKNDPDVYKLRAQVSAKIKSLVSKIYVASVGSAPLLEKAKQEYSAEEINDDDFDDEMEERDVDVTKIDPNDPGVHIRYFQVRFIDEGIRIQPVVPEGKGRALVFLTLDD